MPAGIVADAPPETAKPKDTPVPAKRTACGLPAALSVMLSVALREPIAEGVKVTLTVHLAPAATLPVHVLV